MLNKSVNLHCNSQKLLEYRKLYEKSAKYHINEHSVSTEFLTKLPDCSYTNISQSKFTPKQNINVLNACNYYLWQ